jgi:hypothetical protein
MQVMHNQEKSQEKAKQKAPMDSDDESSVHCNKENDVLLKPTVITKQAKQAPRAQMPLKSRKVISNEQDDDDDASHGVVNAGGAGSSNSGMMGKDTTK